MADYDTIAASMLVQLWDRVRFLNSGKNPNFTSSEKIAIRMSWNKFVAGDYAKRGFESFLKMFENKPETKAVFDFAQGSSSAQMQNSSRLLFHVTRVMKYLDKVVTHLGSLEDVAPLLRQLGGRHGTSGYNVPANFFPYLGVAMRELMKVHVPNWNEKTDALWKKLYEFVIEQMIAGQEEYGKEKRGVKRAYPVEFSRQ